MSSSITCAHTNYTGTTVCFDGILAHYDAIATAGGGAAAPYAWTTMSVKNKAIATAATAATCYDLAPTTITDTATTDVSYMAATVTQSYYATDTAWLYPFNTPAIIAVERCTEFWYVLPADDNGGAIACVRLT